MASPSSLHTSSAHLALHAHVPIPQAGITSRVVLDNPLLRVVHFALDTDEVLTEHSSPRAVVVLLLEGALRFTVEGVDHEMRPGDVVYLAPGSPHALLALAPSRMTLTMVDVDAVPATQGGEQR